MSSPVEQIKQKLSISDVVSTYVRLEKAGGNLKGRCPFHNERTPSFFVSPTRNTYHCFGCGKGGDIFSFVQEIEGVDFPTALRDLAQKAGVILTGTNEHERSERQEVRQVLEEASRFYESELAESAAARAYLEERGVTPDTQKLFRIGFAPDGWSNVYNHLRSKHFSDSIIEASGMCVAGSRGLYDRFRNRILFPVSDYNGALVGFSGRILPGADEKEAKYINSPETILYSKSKVMYGMELAKTTIRSADECIVVEGQLDCILSHQAGVTNVVGVSGTAFTDSHLEIIKRLTDRLTIVLDGDEAGFKASARAVMTALRHSMFVRVVPLPPGLDPADMVRRSPDEWKQALSNPTPFAQYVLGVLSEKIADRRELQKEIRNVLYPYLVHMENVLERDVVFGQIAALLGVSAEAVREDYARKAPEVTRAQPAVSGGTDVSTSEPRSRLTTLYHRILGLLLWQESLAEPTSLAVDIRSRLPELLKLYTGPETFVPVSEVPTDTRNVLVFEAESYYNGTQSLDIEIRQLLASFHKEILKDELARTLDLLRRTEATGKSSDSEALLIRCQELSRSLEQVNDF